MLRVEHLKISNLPPLTFQVMAGECLAVEGPSGSGKTRLLRAIADLDDSDGLVFVEGAERHEMSGPEWRRVVRYVSAEPGWWTDTPRSAFAADPVNRLPRLLQALALSPEMLDQQISALSTGERQRLALARALLDNARVLLLDEPTGALDPGNAALVEELIRYQLLAGRTVLLASHDAGLVSRLAHVQLQLARQQAGTWS